MAVARKLLVAHLVMLALLLGGILYALRHPELWADYMLGRRAFDYGMEYGAPVAAALGAATILAFGFVTAGPIHTEQVFVLAVAGSVGLELIGSSNLPLLGSYLYTDFLGGKLLDRVPYSVPLAAFSMGVSAYLLARAITANRPWSHPELVTSGVATWLFTAWILALGIPTANEDLTVQFWEWQHSIPHFGLALQNCVLWAVASWIVFAAAHRAWGAAAASVATPIGIPFALYAANVGFAMALSASIELILPILLGLLGLIPALFALGYRPGSRPSDAERRGFRPVHAR